MIMIIIIIINFIHLFIINLLTQTQGDQLPGQHENIITVYKQKTKILILIVAILIGFYLFI